MGKFEKGKRPTQAQSYAEPQRAPKKKKQKKQSRLGLIVALLAAAVVLVGCGVGYMFLRDDGRIVNNLYVAGVDLSGMTKEEARAALEKGVSVYGKENMNVALYTRPYDTFTSTYDPAQIPLVDIFGKPLDASAQTEATEPTETAPSETEPVTEAPTEAPTEEPTEDPNTPRDEDGKPMTLLTKLCLTPSDTAVRLDLDKAVEAAYAYGRGGGLFSRVKKNALTERTDLNVADFLTLDESYVRTMLDEYAKDAVSEKTEPSVTEGTTTVTDDEGEERELKTLTVKLGSAGREINTDELYKAVLTAYADANFEMQYVVEEDLPKAFDLDALYHKYYVAPVNAVCDENTYEVTDGSDGYGFDIKKAMDELEKAGPGGEVTLTLDVIKPQYTKESLQEKLFHDELASYDSPYNAGLIGRSENLRLACLAINGYVLKPGETFSFNGVVGERTAAKGYKEGGVYVGGETVQQLGGGVCQVASVLYYCTLKSDLEVIARQEHQYVPDYIPWGMDATIYWGSLDYKFRNNTTYPIRILAEASGGYVRVRFMGTETKDYTVELDYKAAMTHKSKTEEVEISKGMKNYDKYKDYKDGERIQVGYDGYEVDTYRMKYDKNGKLLSTEKVNHSSYDWRNRLVAKLVEETEPPTEAPTEPTESPTESPTEKPTEPEPTEPPTDAPTESTGSDEEAP